MNGAAGTTTRHLDARAATYVVTAYACPDQASTAAAASASASEVATDATDAGDAGDADADARAYATAGRASASPHAGNARPSCRCPRRCRYRYRPAAGYSAPSHRAERASRHHLDSISTRSPSHPPVGERGAAVGVGAGAVSAGEVGVSVRVRVGGEVEAAVAPSVIHGLVAADGRGAQSGDEAARPSAVHHPNPNSAPPQPQPASAHIPYPALSYPYPYPSAD